MKLIATASSILLVSGKYAFVLNSSHGINIQ